MATTKLIFYFFASLAILSAAMVIIAKNPVRSVLFLILSFFATAGLWLLLEAEFLAITLVLVYVGAVMVLFLFVIMMLDIEIATLKEGFTRYLPLGLCVAVLVVLGLVYSMGNYKFKHVQFTELGAQSTNVNQVKELGLLLYTQYIYPFECAGILLLVAIVAAISLTFRGKRGSRTPLVTQQLKVSKKDRLTILKMESES